MASPPIVIEPRTAGARAVPEPEPEPAPRRRRRTGRFPRFVGWLAVACLFWTGWAAGAFYDLAKGLREGDPVALERRIDWDAVRQGLREDLTAEAVANPAVDALLARPALANLLRTARLGANGWDTAPATDPEKRRQSAFGWHRIAYAWFSGGPTAFRVDIEPDGDGAKTPLILLFRWEGDWRLTRVFLPAAATMDTAATAPAPQRAEPQAKPAAAAAPATTEQAVLFEEDPSDPNGKRYTGTVAWRAERIAAAEGGPEFAIVARVAIPERPLGLTLTVRRNLDRALPASHTIEVKFDRPPDSTIEDMVGILMQQSDTVSGQILAGSRVKVRDDFYLIGLSAIEFDVQQNMKALSERPWLAIPFAYAGRGRAVLAIEKGTPGANAVSEALMHWTAAQAAGMDGQKN